MDLTDFRLVFAGTTFERVLLQVSNLEVSDDTLGKKGKEGKEGKERAYAIGVIKPQISQT